MVKDASDLQGIRQKRSVLYPAQILSTLPGIHLIGQIEHKLIKLRIQLSSVYTVYDFGTK